MRHIIIINVCLLVVYKLQITSGAILESKFVRLPVLATNTEWNFQNSFATQILRQTNFGQIGHQALEMYKFTITKIKNYLDL